MKKITNLIEVLEQTIPNLDVQILRENLPKTESQEDVLDWMYKSLSSQELMDYIEWKEYFGEIPDIITLSPEFFPESPNDFILDKVEEIDWDNASADLYSLPYELPYLEHLNFYLANKGLRLVDLAHFENAYIFCIRNNDEIIKKLNEALNTFDMSINERQSMTKEEALNYIDSIIDELA